MPEQETKFSGMEDKDPTGLGVKEIRRKGIGGRKDRQVLRICCKESKKKIKEKKWKDASIRENSSMLFS